MDDDTCNLIFQSFLLGSRLTLIAGNHPPLDDVGLMQLFAGVKRIASADETTINSAADVSVERSPSIEREKSTHENRQFEQEVASIVLRGLPPRIRSNI